MCAAINPPKNIFVAFERDTARRLTEVQIINSDRDGNEVQGVIINCQDNGEITVNENPGWLPWLSDHD